ASRSHRTCDLAGCAEGGCDGCCLVSRINGSASGWNVQVRMIQEIKELRSELKVATLSKTRNGRVFRQREVPGGVERPHKGGSAQITKEACVLDGEAGGIEVLIHSSLDHRAAGNQVGPVGIAASRVSGAGTLPAQNNRKRKTRFDRQD